jgi:hypothetical protein
MLFVFWHFYCLQIQLRIRTTFDESYVYLKIKQEHKKGLKFSFGIHIINK